MSEPAGKIYANNIHAGEGFARLHRSLAPR
jgi:hypothetical protein